MDVCILEVGPRDGLQNEAVHLTVGERVSLIEQLVSAGSKRIEAVSFVSERAVPQMAGAEQVMAAVPRNNDVSYSGLVLNRKGLDRALEAGVDEINFVVCASNTMNVKNQRASTEESLSQAGEIISAAKRSGIYTTLTVATAFGCAFEGEVDPAAVAHIAHVARQVGADELCLADSVGVGVPDQVDLLLDVISEDWKPLETRFHFHNTRNTGYANATAAVGAGVRVLDASVGGIGGCPFAPRATGNIATEDLNYLLQRSGFQTGLKHASLEEITPWLSSKLGKTLPSLLPAAGTFPRSE